VFHTPNCTLDRPRSGRLSTAPYLKLDRAADSHEANWAHYCTNAHRAPTNQRPTTNAARRRDNEAASEPMPRQYSEPISKQTPHQPTTRWTPAPNATRGIRIPCRRRGTTNAARCACNSRANARPTPRAPNSNATARSLGPAQPGRASLARLAASAGSARRPRRARLFSASPCTSVGNYGAARPPGSPQRSPHVPPCRQLALLAVGRAARGAGSGAVP